MSSVLRELGWCCARATVRSHSLTAIGRVTVWLAGCSMTAAAAGASPGGASLEPFLTRYCITCHSTADPAGGLDLASLSRDLGDAASLARWVRLYDRIDQREMPPREAEQPSDGERQQVLQPLRLDLVAAHRAQQGTVLRRLNRREYQNTLNDLFGTQLDLALRLPEDGRSHEFDTVGEALGLSMVQLQRYLEATERVLDAAIVKTIAPPERKVVRASYADTQGGEQFIGKVWLKRDDGAIVFFKQFGYPTGMLREANVQKEGWYQVRVTGYAFQSDQPVTFSIGARTFERGVEEPTFGFFSMPPGAPTTVETRAYIKARYMIDVTPWGLSDRDNEIRQKGLEQYRGPGLAVLSVEVDGPIVEEFPSRGHKLVLDGLNRSEVLPRNPRDRERPNYVPKFDIASDDPVAEARPVLQRVATAAFRRPVSAERIAPYLKLLQDELAAGATFEAALRTTVTAIFCAPEFLYLVEPPGPLDDYALAARLSYFLTRSSPDEELLAAAAAGQLTRRPEVLHQQTERLLRHPHAERFITDFTDAWLNLREIEFTNPDEQLYPEFDRYLQWSMVEETRRFWQTLLTDNLPVRSIVKSDFAMLNERLAEHYGIDNVKGPELRRVALPPDAVRGGFLTQGSVLKVSANGTSTSPVVRGVWVLERLLGETPPPPPPGIPGVEPDIRGASTLRELLDKHRSQQNCRNCHKRIDPPGFALESFDPIGGWRERFRSLGEGTRVDLQVRGQRVRYKLGPPVDASGELPDGRPFQDFRQFRDLLAQEDDILARTLLTKLLTFATGRELGFSDRDEIARLVRKSAEAGHGVRDLVHLVVGSEIFRHK